VSANSNRRIKFIAGGEKMSLKGYPFFL